MAHGKFHVTYIKLYLDSPHCRDWWYLNGSHACTPEYDMWLNDEHLTVLEMTWCRKCQSTVMGDFIWLMADQYTKPCCSSPSNHTLTPTSLSKNPSYTHFILIPLNSLYAHHCTYHHALVIAPHAWYTLHHVHTHIPTHHIFSLFISLIHRLHLFPSFKPISLSSYPPLIPCITHLLPIFSHAWGPIIPSKIRGSQKYCKVISQECAFKGDTLRQLLDNGEVGLWGF